MNLMSGHVFDRPDDVYHVTVMPCYDKKLEASRDDFVFEVDRTNSNGNGSVSISEVDSVLTTGEVLDLIQVRAHLVIFAPIYIIVSLNEPVTYQLNHFWGCLQLKGANFGGLEESPLNTM